MVSQSHNSVKSRFNLQRLHYFRLLPRNNAFNSVSDVIFILFLALNLGLKEGNCFKFVAHLIKIRHQLPLICKNQLPFSFLPRNCNP